VASVEDIATMMIKVTVQCLSRLAASLAPWGPPSEDMDKRAAKDVWAAGWSTPLYCLKWVSDQSLAAFPFFFFTRSLMVCGCCCQSLAVPGSKLLREK
jgi:hypothetical protein